MLPSVVVRQVELALLDYLRTTFRLQDHTLEKALFDFLRNPERGLFKGPYLDLKLPFRRASEGDDIPLDVRPEFTPYSHQLRAFQRLTSLGDHQPENTLVTTGTGSGKTECFLYPVVDHCVHARQEGRRGIKALFIYPMNALASDQAERIAGLIHGQKLGITAGIYVGGDAEHGTMGEKHLIEKRDILRQSPPDILLTNYRMLDFLLFRPEDRALWQFNDPTTLRYLVLDELHTYDGAQGSDVACLIRRIKDRLGIPPGTLTCVGTSATIAGTAPGDPRVPLVEFAQKVFGEPFGLDGVITEDRMTVDDFLVRDHEGPEPESLDLPQVDDSVLDPERYASIDEYLAEQAQAWVAIPPRKKVVLGALLSQHPFLHQLLRAIEGRDGRGGPRHWLEVADTITAREPDLAACSRDRQWLLLSSFLSLVSHAKRVVENREVPFLNAQVQIWVRELRGVVAQLCRDEWKLEWRHELEARPGEHWFPLAHCRECGTAGWVAVQREGETHLYDAYGEIVKAWFGRDRKTRFVLRRAAGEAEIGKSGELFGPAVCPKCLSQIESDRCRCTPEEGFPTVPVRIHSTQTDDHRFMPQCPSCGAENALGLLGSRAASLSSVAVTRLFGSTYNRDRKLLAFTDSVQDASHRAGFYAARAYRFCFRTALLQSLMQHGSLPLGEVPAAVEQRMLQELKDTRALATLLPPDLRDLPEYRTFRSSDSPSREDVRAIRDIVRKRLSWEVTRELGVGITSGRSLTSTGCAAMGCSGEKVARAAERILASLVEKRPLDPSCKPTLEAVHHLVEGILERSVRRGAIDHPLLGKYLTTGTRYLLSKRHAALLPGAGPGAVLPVFIFAGEAHDTFDALLSPPKSAGWFRDWVARSLGAETRDAGIANALLTVMEVLAQEGLFFAKNATRGRVFGLCPAELTVTTDVGTVLCPYCGASRTRPRVEAEHWVGQRCSTYRCGGSYQRDEELVHRAGYYQHLYQRGRIHRVFPAEHTGLLERDVREALEREFKSGVRPDAANLLTCTPTLEMGIDIGDLSSVMLCAVPPLPSNYLQRIGRAGRATGSAAVVAFATARPHDLYFFEEPFEMLRGEVIPPGCFLDAREMLARQLLAHALDGWAKSETRLAIPSAVRYLSQKPKPEAFPWSFYEYYRKHQRALTEQFIGLFAGEMTSDTADYLRSIVRDEELVGRLRNAIEQQAAERTGLVRRLGQVRERLREIKEDPSKVSVPPEDGASGAELELEELESAQKVLRRMLNDASNKHPLNVLSDAGVLPNYAFPEAGVVLKAALRVRDAKGETKETTTGKTRRTEHVRHEYQRPASQALREFAPFNTFYASGHQLRISQLDLGTDRASLLEAWRFCPECHYADLDQETPSKACPRCGAPGWADQGQRRNVVRFRQVWSAMDLLEATNLGETDQRQEEDYRVECLIDVGDEQRGGAQLVETEKVVFGWELLRAVHLREFNFGRLGDTGPSFNVGGTAVSQVGFPTCRDCGKVNRPGQAVQHAPFCRVRTKNADERIESVILCRDMISEAIRVLLPVSVRRGGELLASVRAALHLGLRRTYRGQASHLRITTASEPVDGGRRTFLVVYDAVPGGTGYIADLARPERFFGVVESGLETMRHCRCAGDEHRDGCYRCVYSHGQSAELAKISRRAAVELFERVLAARGELRAARTLSEVGVGSIVESELEERFIEVLGSKARERGFGSSLEPTWVNGRPGWRLSLAQGETRVWRIEPQHTLGEKDGIGVSCRPDFVCWPVGESGGLPIAVFCDGVRYHAPPDEPEGRVWDDFQKRQALLESGRFRVWSVAWHDLDTDKQLVPLFAAPLGQVEHSLRQKFYGKIPPERWLPDGATRCGSFELLIEYLQNPDDDLWQRGMLASLVASLPIREARTRESVAAVRSALVDPSADLAAMPSLGSAPNGTEVAALWRAHWARLLVTIPRDRLSKSEFGALRTTLRLHDAQAARREDDFEQDWRGALHAVNVLQFVTGEVELCTTELLEKAGEVQPLELGNLGKLGEPKRRSTHPPPGLPDAVAELGQEYPEAKAVLVRLAADKLPIPVPYEGLYDGKRILADALLGWPDLRVALWTRISDADRAVWSAHGWVAVDLEEDDCPETVVRALTSRLPKQGAP